MKILPTKSLYYSDVNLIAQFNDKIKSRKDIPEEKWRIIVSPMPAIVGERFARVALEEGLSVCLHRFDTIAMQCQLAAILWKDRQFFGLKNKLWVAVGINDYERVEALYKIGCRDFIVDAANGYLSAVVEYAHTLNLYLWAKNKQQNHGLMVGNVHTSEGCDLYNDLHGVLVRVGIAGGSACDTQKMTAINRGQITELKECYENPRRNYLITSDGGISSPGNAAKAFGCGADYIMMGGYFSKAEQSQSIIDKDYKFWGCASQYNQAKYGEIRRHSEGKVLEIDKNEIKPLKVLVDDLWGGISSAVSYSGYGKLSDFIGNAVMEIKHS